MQRVAVARQRADGQAGVGDHLRVCLRRVRIARQRIEVEMILPRPAAGPELERHRFPAPAPLSSISPRIECAVDRREQTELHRAAPMRAATLVQTPPWRWLSSTASTTHAA